LDLHYRSVAKRLVENRAVTITKEGQYARISLRRQHELHESDRLKRLCNAVYALPPQIHLPKLLLRVHALTGFADKFTYISEDRFWTSGLPLTSCAIPMAEACNIGIDGGVNSDVPALEQSRLLWAQHNNIRQQSRHHGQSKQDHYQVNDLPQL